MIKTEMVKPIFLAIVVAFGFGACTLEERNPMSGEARLNVMLVDAPGDYDEVWVEVVSAEILPSGKEEEEASAWISIPYEAEDNKINLLTLVGENYKLIGTKAIPAGRISQVRLVLGEDNYLVKDGEQIPLTTPSAQQSGLKLQVDQELMPGIQYDLMLDFNVARSVVMAGASGNSILKPVIRVVGQESASIRGKIIEEDAKPVIYGIAGEDTVSTFTDNNGVFILRGLKAEEYDVHIYPREPFAPKFVENVMTASGEVKEIGNLTLEKGVEE